MVSISPFKRRYIETCPSLYFHPCYCLLLGTKEKERKGKKRKGKERKGKKRKGKERKGKERKERKGKKRKGKKRKGRGRKGKERKEKERKEKERKGKERKGKEKKGKEGLGKVLKIFPRDGSWVSTWIPLSPAANWVERVRRNQWRWESVNKRECR